MKYVVVFLSSICFSLAATAQVTIDDRLYPVAGDSLVQIVTQDVDSGLVVSPAGPDQMWAYDSLPRGLRQVTRYVAIEDADRTVSGATLASQIPATGGWIYYGETEDYFGLLAFDQEVPIEGVPDIFASYDVPLSDYYASLQYEDTIRSESYLISSAFGGDIIPQEILDSLMLPLVPDSIRVEQDYNRTSIVDAWGTLVTPSGSFEVIRERREDRTQGIVGIKAGFLPFISIPIGPEMLQTQYIYWNPDNKAPILVETADSSGAIIAMQYLPIDAVTALDEALEITGVTTFPNPATDAVTIDMDDRYQGAYTIRFYDTQGRLIGYDLQAFLAAGQNISLPTSTDPYIIMQAIHTETGQHFTRRILIAQ